MLSFLLRSHSHSIELWLLVFDCCSVSMPTQLCVGFAGRIVRHLVGLILDRPGWVVWFLGVASAAGSV